MQFKDQLVRCGACGTQFVYTVHEQRRRAQNGLPVEAPSFCEACRGADVRLAEADGPSATPPAGAKPTAGADDRGPATRRQGHAPANGGGSPAPERGRQRGSRGSRPPRRQSDGSAPRPARSASRGPNRQGGRSGGQGRGAGRSPRQSRQTEPRVRHLGTVRWFDVERGFGFIAEEDGEDVFVHCSAILVSGERQLQEGQPVEFEVEQTDRGLQAVDVVPLA